MKFHIIEQDFFRVQFEYRKAVGVMDETKETFVSSYLLYLLLLGTTHFINQN